MEMIFQKNDVTKSFLVLDKMEIKNNYSIKYGNVDMSQIFSDITFYIKLLYYITYLFNYIDTDRKNISDEYKKNSYYC